MHTAFVIGTDQAEKSHSYQGSGASPLGPNALLDRIGIIGRGNFAASIAYPPPLGLVDHFKIYNVQPNIQELPVVSLEDQFGLSPNVKVEFLLGLGVPVSKAIAPDPAQPGDLLQPDKHVSVYIITNSISPTTVHVTNQFGTHNWTLGGGERLLLVPAIKDGQGDPAILLGQHWN